MMKRMADFLLPRAMRLAMLVLWAIALPAQSPAFFAITPDKVIMVIGDSRTFRMVDQNGHRPAHVTWTISDPDAFQVEEGDDLVITSKRAGDFRVTGQSTDGSAEASVSVQEGTTLPAGTAMWTSGTTAGCKSVKLTQAMPSANGPDMYEQSHCDDGDYITAYTADGLQMWRRKLGGDPGAPSAAGIAKNADAPARLNPRSASICDLVVMGTEQQKIRDLLRQHNLTFSEGSPAERVWTVDESGTQCKLWFDDKAILSKKRKIFTTQ
jgi:hypothetical protein